MGILDIFRSKARPLEETYRDQKSNAIVTNEVAQWGYALADGKRWNPDDLVGKKGLTIYSQMLNDEQVKSVTEFKLNAILGRGYQFKMSPKSKLSKEEQQERIDVFEAVLQQMRGSFVDALEGIASGREFGFSITEKVYGDIQVNDKAFVGINMLLTRDPCSFEFYAEPSGLLKKMEQRTNGLPVVNVDPDKVIHYVHKPKWDLIYGRSELRSAYRSWYAKDQLIKFWLLHLEKFGSGMLVATQTGESGLSGTEKAALQTALANAKALAAILMPKGVELAVEFPTSTDQYEKALQYFDLAIAKSQLVPNLLGLSHTGQTGAYSQSQTQFEAFFWTTSADGSRLSECLNEQLFRDLGDQNWKDGDYPRFCFKPVSVEHIKWMLETWKGLIGANAVISTEEDERVIRQLLEMPEREEGTEALVDPMEDRKQTHTEDQAGIANERADKEFELRKQEAEKAKTEDRFARLEATIESLRDRVVLTVHNPAPVQPASPPSAAQSATANAAGAEVVPHGELRTATKAQFSRAAQRVAFSVIEKRTDDYAKAAVDTLSTIVAKATKRALGDDASLSALVDEDQTDVAALDINGADRSKLKGTYRDLLIQSWTLGSDMAANELDRARGEKTAALTRKAKFVSLRDNAAAYFDTQSFRMAGDTSDQTRKLIQQELQNGIKFGKTLTEIRTSIWERLIAKGLTSMESVKGVETSEAVVSALEALLLDDVSDVRPYLNTLVRTNTFEALNEARFAEFTDPAVSEFVQALEYAAVLDSSTTTICEELNGAIYRADSPVWDKYRAPNHFNCRSVLVPITTVDGWNGEESPEPSVEPQEGFK